MKKIKLTKMEKVIEDSLLRGEYVKVPNKKLEKILQSLAVRKKDKG